MNTMTCATKYMQYLYGAIEIIFVTPIENLALLPLHEYCVELQLEYLTIPATVTPIICSS